MIIWSSFRKSQNARQPAADNPNQFAALQEISSNKEKCNLDEAGSLAKVR
jgi:hypothetical protein